MILGRFAPFTALACGLCFLIGCASPRNDVNRVSADLEHRSGHTLTNAKPGEIVLPASVSFDDGLSEDEAVTLALWNNAAFQETLADLGLSRADLVQAGMLPNPTLSMLFPVGAKPFELTAKYPLEAFWLRPRRVAAAKLDYERTAHRLVQSGLDLIRDVRLACADLGLANQRLVLAETTEKLNRAIAEQARARLRAGEASELETASANIDTLQAREQFARATQDASLARERLRFQMGLGVDHWQGSLRESPVPTGLSRDVSVLVTNALAVRPDLRAAELGLAAAGKRLGLAKTEIYTFTIALNAKEVGADFLAGPGLDIPVPIFNQNQGGIAQAQAKFEKAARQYITVRDRIVLEVREAHTRLAQAQESHDQWQTHILPQLEESARLAEKSYAAGNVTYLFVLENNRKVSDARLKAAIAAADVRRARAELERSVGQRLESNASPLSSISK
jgi:cobalt-zinc-cadmium efflux system outer membrane protein